MTEVYNKFNVKVTCDKNVVTIAEHGKLIEQIKSTDRFNRRVVYNRYGVNISVLRNGNVIIIDRYGMDSMISGNVITYFGIISQKMRR